VKALLRKLRGGTLIGVGYLLSPLSWWNDLFFNLPIALALGYAASWLKGDWFVPGTLVGYWLSNVLGMVLLQWGATDVLLSPEQANPKRDLLIGLGSSTLYTVVIAVLVYWQVLPVPDFLFNVTP
jgi:hypothetical protein